MISELIFLTILSVLLYFYFNKTPPESKDQIAVIGNYTVQNNLLTINQDFDIAYVITDSPIPNSRLMTSKNLYVTKIQEKTLVIPTGNVKQVLLINYT